MSRTRVIKWLATVAESPAFAATLSAFRLYATGAKWRKAIFVVTSLLLFFFAGLVPATAQTWPNGYSYRRKITIDHTKVPNTDQSNFPVLISGTYSDLATTGNGGNVTNSSGYDIIFTSDAAGATTLAFEQESYAASSGAVKYWVQVPTVSHSSDTAIYMFYGNSSITTDQSNKTGTWDSNYKGVWHLPNGTTLTANDSTSGAHNGTLAGSTTPTAVTGEIDGGAGFNGSTAYIDVPGSSSLEPATAITISGWTKYTTANAEAKIYSRPYRSDSSWNSPWISAILAASNSTTGKPYIAIAVGGQLKTGYSTTVINDGTWHYVVGTYDGSNMRVYVDGQLSGSATAQTGNIDYSGATAANVSLGSRSKYNNGEFMNGNLDEIRVSAIARSSDWVATEYNSQNSPSTFYSVGSSQSGVSAPVISSLSSSSGSPGDSITVTGTHFGASQGSSTVTFNGSAATVASWSDTSIVVTVPLGAVTGNVVVTVSEMPSNGISFTVGANPWSNGYNYRRTITIDHTKVPNTDQSNFPVLISGTYSDLATTGNGGNVTNSSGYDIIFTSDAAGATTLAFEQESYAASSGAVKYWVQVPTVSHSSDTAIYMFYGNSSITTDQSNKTGTWDSNYKGVWHLPNGTTLTANDSTSGAHNGTLAGSTTPTAVTGEIDGGAGFNGSTAYIDVPGSSSLEPATAITISGWTKYTTANAEAKIYSRPYRSDSSWNSPWISAILAASNSTTGKPYIAIAVGGQLKTGYSTTVINDGTWHYVVGTYDGSNMRVYVDGQLSGSATAQTGNIDYSGATAANVSLGSRSKYNNGEFMNGNLDEIRVSAIARSSDWVATEYNSQNSPSTFYSVGSSQSGMSVPQITSLSPTTGAVGASVTITGTYFGPNQASGASTVKFNGTAATATSWSSTSIVTLVPSGATTGNVALTVSGSTSNGSSFTVVSAPSITSLSRTSGIVGVAVTIAGSNFGSSQGSGTVTFNGVTASITSWSASSIVASVPSGATTGNVVVFASGVNGNGSSFTVLPTPNITSLSRTSGAVGTPVTVTGTNFGSSQSGVVGSVAFNGTAAVVTSWSSTSIATVVPSGATTGNVVVTANGGPSNGVSFSIGSPAISSLSPTSGGVSTSVTITGTNFGSSQGSSTVKFNGTTATSISSWGSTSIVATVPSGASTGNIVVAVSGVSSDGVVFSVTTTLSGTVTNQSGGAAISGASVQAFQNGVSKGSTTTSGSGTYSISSLQTGSYDVKFSASSFGAVLQAAVSISSGGTTLNQTLSTPGTIAGQITQSNGTTAISGATIAVLQSSESIATATSDGSGNYSISNLSAGTYSVEASASGYVPLGQNGVSVTSSTTTTENLSLNALGTLPISYIYDSLGRLIGVVDTAGEAAGYNYDSVGNLLAITRGSSTQTSVISFSPSKGPVGTAVTIYGTGFSTTTSSDSVSFNGTAATVTAATTTSLSVTVPSGATTGTISVTSPNGTAASATSFTVTSTSGAPTITSFSPTVATPGTSVTISGTNFETATANDKLRFSYQKYLTTVTAATSTSLTSSVATGATSGKISLSTPGGTVVSTDDFFVPPGSHVASDVVFTGRVAMDSNIAVSIGTAGKIGLVVFDGTAGQNISVTFTSQTITGFSASVFNPDGSTLFQSSSPLGGCCSGYPMIGRLTLPSTGTYTLMVAGYSTYTGSVTANLYNIPDVTGAIPADGTTTTVSTSKPSQNIAYTFSGTAGQIVFLSVSGVTYYNVHATIVKPGGTFLITPISVGSGYTSFIDRTTLPTTGTYTVLAYPDGSPTGSVTLNLYTDVDWTGTATVGGSGVSVSLPAEGQDGILTFSGTSGQQVTVHMTINTYGYISVALKDPSGTTLTSTWTNGSFNLSTTTLSTTGTYTVYLSHYATGTGSITVTLTSP